MTTARQLRYSYEDYLRSLERSELKLEYCAGVIYAMAGGTPTHAELAAAVISLLRPPLQGRCSVYTSDLKVRVEASDFSAFPDVSVVCGERQLSPIDANAIVNPGLLIEVTSRSTEEYDRGEKTSHYQRLPSVRAVLLVSHRSPNVTVVERGEAGWTERQLGPGERVTLAQPAIDFAVDELYAGITLEPR
jgi:Uma2 family endonuclease